MYLSITSYQSYHVSTYNKLPELPCISRYKYKVLQKPLYNTREIAAFCSLTVVPERWTDIVIAYLLQSHDNPYLHGGSEWMNYQMDRRRKLRYFLSKHGYTHRKEMQESWIAFLSASFHHFPLLSPTFQYFGGWVNGQTVLKEKRGADIHTNRQTILSLKYRYVVGRQCLQIQGVFFWKLHGVGFTW